MPQNLGFLFAAFAVTWVAFFGYVVYVQRQLAETQRRLRWLQEDRPPDPAEWPEQAKP